MIVKTPTAFPLQLYQETPVGLYPLFTFGPQYAMEASRPSTSYTVSQSLPPITALTNELPPPEPSPGFLRDSGNWSISQSKRTLLLLSTVTFSTCRDEIYNLSSEFVNMRFGNGPSLLVPQKSTNQRRTDSSGISNTGGLQIQTILNAEDSPSRVSIPETPHSTRVTSQVCK
jgi:hypothetical protein